MDTVEEVLLESEDGMDTALEHLKHEMTKLRTGRANAGMLDHVQVDYHGAMTPIRSLARVGVLEGRTLMVQPYDKNSLKMIEIAIAQKGGLDVPIQSDGSALRMTLPELTTESRQALVREMKKRGEEAKIQVRNARRTANDAAKKLEKDRKISEDDTKKALEDIQKLTDSYCEKIDEAMETKEKDILEI